MYSITLQYSAPSPSAVIGGVIEHPDEVRALQGQDSEFGKELLLANAQTERAAGQVV